MLVENFIQRRTAMATKNSIVLEDPVGLREISTRLHVSIHTARMWRNRERMPKEVCVVSNVPLWSWSSVEEWADKTGRLAEARRRNRSNGHAAPTSTTKSTAPTTPAKKEPTTPAKKEPIAAGKTTKKPSGRTANKLATKA